MRRRVGRPAGTSSAQQPSGELGAPVAVDVERPTHVSCHLVRSSGMQGKRGGQMRRRLRALRDDTVRDFST